VALLIAEIKIASHGVLTIGGLVSMVLGSFMLYEAPEAGFRVSWAVILPTGGERGLVVLASLRPARDDCGHLPPGPRA